MISTVEKYNPDVIKECRLQLSLPPEEVQKKVPKILDIESGKKTPTFKQLDTLSKLYNVPRWVFIRSSIPDQYKFEKVIPGFRQLKDSDIDTDPHTSSHVRAIMARMESMRSFFLQLDAETENSIQNFHPPEFDNNVEQLSINVRKWLGVADGDCFSFEEWKSLIEEKDIFVFMTSKYKSWSHVDRASFRGLSIYHEKLPIIVINDSDAKKAQSFTIFHELCHLFRQESTADNWSSSNNVESWCDNFAASFLMPKELFVHADEDLASLKKTAARMKVSPYACLVRQRQIGLIDQNIYNLLEEEIKNEWIKQQKLLKAKEGGPSRNRAREIYNQYGKLTRTILQAYNENIINLHKVMTILELKKANYVSDLIGQL